MSLLLIFSSSQLNPFRKSTWNFLYHIYIYTIMIVSFNAWITIRVLVLLSLISWLWLNSSSRHSVEQCRFVCVYSLVWTDPTAISNVYFLPDEMTTPIIWETFDNSEPCTWSFKGPPTTCKFSFLSFPNEFIDFCFSFLKVSLRICFLHNYWCTIFD